jgi:hypothetical protein
MYKLDGCLDCWLAFQFQRRRLATLMAGLCGRSSASHTRQRCSAALFVSRTRLSSRKRVNAIQRLGGYSNVTLLPWEHPDEFEQLRREIWEELQPEGPLQEDAATTILLCRWRKERLRLKRKLDTAVALNKVENRVFKQEAPPLFDTRIEKTAYRLGSPSSGRSGPAPDHYQHLLSFSSSFYGEKEAWLVKLSVSMLPGEYRDHLNTQVPQTSFENTEQWIRALKNEVDTVLMPMVRNRLPDPNDYVGTAAELLAADPVLADLEIEDRLDATSDRALRRLFWLKTQKQMDRELRQKVINAKPATRPVDSSKSK